MPEFYPAPLTARSRALFRLVRDWAAPRHDVCLIGGWAVVELVDPILGLASRDIDLVFRTSEALKAFDRQAPEWGLRPDVDPVDRRGLYRLVEHDASSIGVDVFTTKPTPWSPFPRGASIPTKALGSQGFLPPLDWLVRDKVETIPRRMGADAYEKQHKDLLDLHRLVFHNRGAVPPRELLSGVSAQLRREAGGARVERAIRSRPEFADDFRKVAQWLRSD